MINNFVRILIKHINADYKWCDRHPGCVKHKLPAEELCRNTVTVKHALPEQFYHRIQWIKLNEPYKLSAFKSFEWIQNRHHIHQKLCAHIPDIFYIPKININYRKHQADAHRKHKQQYHWQEHKNYLPAYCQISTAADAC